jgi:tRNA (guanine-N7-)-methyltransferase
MGKNKLFKFSELSSFPNTYQNYEVKDPKLIDYQGEEVDMKGNWHEQHFKNQQPITLELACGGGEYTVALARKYPDRNFIGIDIKGNRIWKGAKEALDGGVANAAFLRTRIEQLDLFFAENEVSEIWITFADPFLKPTKSQRRLTSSRFLEIYRKVLKKDGLVHLKTDSQVLYQFTLGTIAEEKLNLIYHSNDIYSAELYTEELEVKTYYEKMHLEKGKAIKYVRYTI